MDGIDGIIDEYCRETNLVIGASRPALRRFLEWQMRKAMGQSAEEIKCSYCNGTGEVSIERDVKAGCPKCKAGLS